MVMRNRGEKKEKGMRKMDAACLSYCSRGSDHDEEACCSGWLALPRRVWFYANRAKPAPRAPRSSPLWTTRLPAPEAGTVVGLFVGTEVVVAATIVVEVVGGADEKTYVVVLA